MSVEGFSIHEGWPHESETPVTFDDLYAAHFAMLVAYCRRQVGGGGDPEAIAQDAFTRAWRSWDRYTGSRPFWPWLVTIARRLCIDYRRREMRHSAVPVSMTTSGDFTALPEERLELAEDRKQALQALCRLKPGDRRVVELRDIDGWSYEQIARLEGVTVESIRGSLKRARVALRRAYERVGQGALAGTAVRSVRQVRTRSSEAVLRVQYGMNLGTSTLGPLADIVAGVILLSMAAGAIAPGAAPDHSVALPRPTTATPASNAVGAGVSVGGSPAAIGHDLGASGPGEHGWKEASGGAGTGNGSTLLPGAEHVRTPEDATFTDFTPSPNYVHDGTVFGVGAGTTGCAQECAVLFRSADRGATWERLPGLGFAGGHVLLPPSFPTDARIFVAGPTGLQVSTDGGAQFTTVVPFVGPAFLSPDFARGDQRVLVGAAPGWEYRADVGTTTPMTAAPPATNTAPSFTIAFSPTFREDRTFYIGGSVPVGTNPQASTVFKCIDRSCGAGTTLPTSAGSPNLLMVPRSAGGDALFGWRTDALFVSRDAGTTFQRVTPPVAGSVRSMSTDGSGAAFLLIETAGAMRLFTSTDGARTWAAGVGPLPGAPRKVVALPQLLLSAPKAEAGGGILCSTDNGGTWRRRCS